MATTLDMYLHLPPAALKLIKTFIKEQDQHTLSLCLTHLVRSLVEGQKRIVISSNSHTTTHLTLGVQLLIQLINTSQGDLYYSESIATISDSYSHLMSGHPAVGNSCIWVSNTVKVEETFHPKALEVWVKHFSSLTATEIISKRNEEGVGVTNVSVSVQALALDHVEDILKR